jgi:hypothetical protein
MLDYGDMLDELLQDESDKMTPWEVEFIESLDRQRAAKGDDWRLSDKQQNVLQRVWDKVLG